MYVARETETNILLKIQIKKIKLKLLNLTFETKLEYV
jgi:hypothetical protein